MKLAEKAATRFRFETARHPFSSARASFSTRENILAREKLILAVQLIKKQHEHDEPLFLRCDFPAASASTLVRASAQREKKPALRSLCVCVCVCV
jgi:hypothetical protein